MNNLYISIFIILLIIVIIVAFIFFYQKKSYLNEQFINNDDTNNILNNSSFSDGKHLKQYSTSSGKNDIIVFPNSGSSSYVLRQSKNKKENINSPIFYKINIELKPNTIYNLNCLYFSTNNNPLRHKITFNNNDVIYLKTKVDTNKSKDKFSYLYSLFKTPSSNANNENIKTTIDFSFNYNNLQGFNYFTNLHLSQLVETDGLPYTNDLRCYFNSFNSNAIQKNNKNIKDLSGNGFDFIASNPSNIDIGDFILSNNILKGPNSFQLQNGNKLKLNPSFTVFILVRGTPQRIPYEPFSSKIEMEEEENIHSSIQPSGNPIIYIPGNQQTALSLDLPPEYGEIYITTGGTTFKTDIKSPTYLDNMMAIVYDGNSFTFFLNEEPILHTECPKIYFDNQPFIINKTGNFQGKFYSFAYYNTNLHEEQIRKLSRYFLKMKANGEDITNLTSKISEELPSFLIPPINPPSIPDATSLTVEPPEINCPKTIFEDGHYYVIVPEGSKISQTVGYSGIRDYGTNIDTAKQIFETNFPQCPIPDILDKRKYKGDLSNCPFIMLVPENPCNQFDCRNIQWDKDKIKNKNCKRSIDVYCSKYADVDPACYCWKKEHRDTPECLKWRGLFEAEDKCDFRKHNIQKHPDYKNYIKIKDIPCWGCNLSAPESSTNQYACRKGSGAR